MRRNLVTLSLQFLNQFEREQRFFLGERKGRTSQRFFQKHMKKPGQSKWPLQVIIREFIETQTFLASFHVANPANNPLFEAIYHFTARRARYMISPTKDAILPSND